MAILPKTGMVTADLGTQGWNTLYSRNFEILDSRIGALAKSDLVNNEDVKIQLSSDDGSTKLTVINSGAIEKAFIDSSGKINCSSISVNGTKVVGVQQPAIAEVSENSPTTTDNAIAINQIINTMKNHGLIAQ